MAYRFASIILVLAIFLTPLDARETRKENTTRKDWLEAAINAAASNGLSNSYRVLDIGFTNVKSPDGQEAQASALIYDYQQNKTYRVIMDASSGLPGTILEVFINNDQPPPVHEEYEIAKNLVKQLERVKKLVGTNIVLQEGFPVRSPGVCEIHRCVEILVMDMVPKVKADILLVATVDLSNTRVVDVREPKAPYSVY